MAQTKAKQWIADGGDWRYRRPVFNHGKWRVRRRHLVTGDIETITLDAKKWLAAQEETLKHAAKAKAEREHAAAGLPGPTDMPIQKAMDLWIAALEGQVREATRDRYEMDAEQYKKLFPEGRLVREVTYADLEELLNKHWSADAARTRIKHRGAFKRFFAWAMKRGYCAGNPALSFEIPRKWSKEASHAARETGQAITYAEAVKLLEVARSPFKVVCVPKKFRVEGKDPEKTDVPAREGLWEFLFVSLRTALRRGNVLGTAHKPALAWRNVNLEAGILEIAGEHMKGDEKLEVPLHEELVAYLQGKLKSLGRVPRPSEPIVDLPRTADVTRLFERVCRQAGLAERNLRIHDLRHTAISWLADKVPHAICVALAGHAPRDMTGHYSHPTVETMREALNALPWLTRPEKAKAGLDSHAVHE